MGAQKKPDPIQIAILTVSDRASAGVYEDKSGPALQELARQALNADVVDATILPDEQAAIAAYLREQADGGGVDLILTTGGTGFAPRDVTPEATRAVIDKEAPGLSEAMREASRQITPHAMLSRSVTGIRGRTLIVNLPGSPKGATENLRVILPALPHAIELLRETPTDASAHHFHARRHA
jgi:molybdenum cofactor synthesis domain-containing protein